MFNELLMKQLIKMRSVGLWLGVLGAIKMFANAFGYSILGGTQINDVSNTLAMLFTLIGIVATHRPTPPTN